MKARPRVLVIAGSDSSGGAGLVRDVQVIADFGARASCVITAVTSQTHSQVLGTCRLTPEVVLQQLRTALQSGPVGAIKIGMLASGAIVCAVLKELPDRARTPIVVDPVLSSSSGTALLDSEGVDLLRDQLLRRSTVVTPNLIEAATLLGCAQAIGDVDQATQAEQLLQFGPEAVLLKGGHGAGEEAVDVLATRSAAPIFLRGTRVNANMRGTGCALSSAIAALLAAGASMESACREAKAYMHKELVAAASR